MSNRMKVKKTLSFTSCKSWNYSIYKSLVLKRNKHLLTYLLHSIKGHKIKPKQFDGDYLQVVEYLQNLNKIWGSRNTTYTTLEKENLVRLYKDTSQKV